MPSKIQILRGLEKESTPVSRERLATILGETSYRTFQTQLDRLKNQGLVRQNEMHEYWITDLGSRELVETEINKSMLEPNRLFLYITEFDLSRLDDKEFSEVWQALGKIIRKRITV